MVDPISAPEPGDAAPEALRGYNVDHLGIVVPDLAQAMQFYRDVLSCPVGEPVVPLHQEIAVSFVRFANVRIELIAPTTDVSRSRTC